MLRRRVFLVATTAAAFIKQISGAGAAAGKTFPVSLSDAEWRKKLTVEQYEILRKEGTERPNASDLLNEHRNGNFACAGCDQNLFTSDTKFESRTGWPSFWAPINGAVGVTRDTAYGMVRNAVHCSRCGGHLGHVFKDGPKPTGLRYCMNGLVMKFRPAAA